MRSLGTSEGSRRPPRSNHSSATSVALAQLDGFHGTTVYDLVDFMERFNLGFSAAKTPAERALYNELYHLLAEQRNQLNDLLGPAEDAVVLDRLRPPAEIP